MARNSIIKLYSEPGITSGVQKVFKNKANQTSYFESIRIKTYNQMSYLKNTGSFKVQDKVSFVKDARYLSFSNPGYEGLIIYAKIVDWVYINENTTEIFYSVDYFQTYMFDFDVSDVTIEREHLSVYDKNRLKINPYIKNIREMESSENMELSESSYRIREESDYKKLDMGLQASARQWVKIDTTMLTNDTISDRFADLMTQSTLLDLTEHSVDNKAWGTGSGALTSYRKIFKMNGFDNYGPERADMSPYTTKYNIIRFPDRYNGVVSPLTTFFLPIYIVEGDFTVNPLVKNMVELDNTLSVGERVKEFLDELALSNLISSVVSISLVPEYAIYDPLLYVDNDGSIQKRAKPHSGHNIDLSSLPSFENVDPKLMRAPFTHLTLMSPDEISTKIYSLEDFLNISEGIEDPEFGDLIVTTSPVSNPIVSVVPSSYVNRGATHWNANFKDMLQYGDYPEMAYNTDNFLTWLGSTKAQMDANNRPVRQVFSNITAGLIKAGNTEMPSYNFNSVDKMSLGSGQGSTGVYSGGMSLSMGGLPAYAMDAGASIANDMLDTKDYFDVINTANGNKPIKGHMKDMKALMSGGSYNATSATAAGSIYAYIQKNFKYVIDRLKPDVYNNYVRYFDNYGYNSGRLGNPRILHYISNGDQEILLPEFRDVDGVEQTYCSTATIKVYAPTLPASDAIEQLFQNGCRFVKGD